MRSLLDLIKNLYNCIYKLKFAKFVRCGMRSKTEFHTLCNCAKERDQVIFLMIPKYICVAMKSKLELIFMAVSMRKNRKKYLQNVTCWCDHHREIFVRVNENHKNYTKKTIFLRNS